MKNIKLGFGMALFIFDKISKISTKFVKGVSGKMSNKY